jgi:hypothetical protein
MRFKDYLLEAKRTTPELFIQMVRDAAPDNITKLTIVDLKKIAADNDVQVPTAIYHNPDLKNGPHMWNFSGGNADDADVDQKVSDDLGVEVDGDSKKDTEEYKKLARLNRAQEISRLAAGGKIYLFGRKPKGAFFRIPNAEEVTAQLERMLSRELANSGDASMEEQYELLIDKVKLVAGGQSKFIKSILITGAPSSGKTFCVMQAIKGLGLTAGKDYVVKKGRVTTISMYRTLIEQINGLTIFDDCDSVFDDSSGGVNMLKGALDTDPVREISNDVRGAVNTAVLSPEQRYGYCEAVSRALRNEQTPEDMENFKNFFEHTGAMPKLMKKLGRQEKDEDGNVLVDNDSLDDVILDHVKTALPNKIDYRGRIIFISNLTPDEIDSAIISRAFTQNMDFRSDEMLDYIDKVKEHIDASITDEEKQEVMDYIRELWKTGKLKSPVNFRLVQQAFDLRLTSQWMKILSQM